MNIKKLALSFIVLPCLFQLNMAYAAEYSAHTINLYINTHHLKDLKHYKSVTFHGEPSDKTYPVLLEHSKKATAQSPINDVKWDITDFADGIPKFVGKVSFNVYCSGEHCGEGARYVLTDEGDEGTGEGPNIHDRSFAYIVVGDSKTTVPCYMDGGFSVGKSIQATVNYRLRGDGNDYTCSLQAY